jgi:hypothetical protein
MHKMNVRLDPEFIYCLMATPQWDLQEEGLLPAAFQALAKTRQTLKVNLYAHCPEPAPESDTDKAPSPTLETRNSALETQRNGIQIQEDISCKNNLAQPPFPLPLPWRQLNRQPKHQREISAKNIGFGNK